MNFSRSGISRFATAAAWMAIAVACGARTTIDFGDDGYGGGSNDQGGTSNHGGTTTVTSGPTTTGTTTAGTTTGGFGAGGAPVGGTGGTGIGPGGSFGSAGSSSCRDLGCPDIFCGPGFQTQTVPGACCPGCQPCTMVACPAVKCGTGSHLEISPGQCCGNCVPDPKSCAQGEKEYEQSRAQLYDKYSSQGCLIDSDCTIAPENNLCVNRCGVPLAKTMVGNWVSNSTSFAQSSCAACPKIPIPPCPPTKVACVMNRCGAF